MVKRLPISTPPIVSYLHHAYPLSIISAHEETLPWFYSNYIQLFYYFRDGYFHMNFFMPWNLFPSILTSNIDNNLFTNVVKRDIAQFLIDCIDNDIYVYVFIDEYYVPGRRAFEEYHFKHDNFIFGYNLEKQYFDITGFKNFTYGSSTIGFNQLERAFSSPGKPDELTLYQYRNTTFEFDKELVAEYIHDYLYAENTFKRLRMIYSPLVYGHLSWGLRVYDGMSQYIEILMRKESKINYIPFHVLYEHKKCMRMRVEYMIKNDYLTNLDELLDFYLSFEKETLILRNLVLKSILDGTETTHKKIKERYLLLLKNMVPQEEALLKQLLHKLT